MSRTLAIGEGNPLYLGRSLEDWFADFRSDQFVDDMQLPCKALVSCRPEYVRWELQDAYLLKEDNPSLVCQALPCFGMAFVHKAAGAIPEVDERRQARLVFSIAKTGWESVPWLVQLLEHPSANVRAAACMGLAEVINPCELHSPPVVLQWKKGFLRGPTLSQVDVDAFFDKMDALFESPEAKVPIPTETLTALIQRLKDDYKSVRIAAAETLRWLAEFGKIEVSVTSGIIAALAKRLEDDCQAVRIAAMRPLTRLGFQGSPLRNDNARLYNLIDHSGSDDKATHELVCHGIIGHLRSLSNDPNPDVREKAERTIAFCKMVENVPLLSRRDARNLLWALNDADSVDGHQAVVRQEAAYALEWWAEQWESPEERGNKPDSLKPGPIIPEPALRVQGRICELAKAPLEEVAEGLRDQDIAVRIAALDALVKIFRTRQDVSDYVFDMLEDPCQQVRWRAHRTLGHMVRLKSGA